MDLETSVQFKTHTTIEMDGKDYSTPEQSVGMTWGRQLAVSSTTWCASVSLQWKCYCPNCFKVPMSYHTLYRSLWVFKNWAKHIHTHSLASPYSTSYLKSDSNLQNPYLFLSKKTVTEYSDCITTNHTSREQRKSILDKSFS